MNVHVTNSQKQQGAALIIGLTLLMALTIIGIGTLSTTSLEHRMVGNMADANVAFNAAESAAKILGGPNGPILGDFKVAGLPDCTKVSPGTTPCYRRNLANDPAISSWWDEPNWWSSNSAITIKEPNITDPESPPELIIEDIAHLKDHLRLGHDYKEPSSSRFYRITTRATGLSDNTQAVTQQVVKKRLN